MRFLSNRLELALFLLLVVDFLSLTLSAPDPDTHSLLDTTYNMAG